jgi:hypothetical protein
MTEEKFVDISTLSPYFSKEKLDLINSLILEKNKKYIRQIMISNNINFKIQLKQYGGFGYCNLFKNYFTKIVKLSDLNNNEINLIFKENLLNLLAWWTIPKKEEKKIKMIACSK